MVYREQGLFNTLVLLSTSLLGYPYGWNLKIFIHSKYISHS